MKYQLTLLVLLLLTNLIIINSISNSKSKNNQSLDSLQSQLFSTPRDSTCISDKQINQIGGRVQNYKDSSSLATSKDFTWMKNWGYGESSFVYDFLEPVFLTKLTDEFTRIYTTVKKFGNIRYKGYTDPFISGFVDSTGTTNTDNKSYQSLQENFNKETYSASINAVQIKQAIENFFWKKDESAKDPIADFVSKYDMNGDSRLSPRELILGVITENKDYFGISQTTYCFEGIIPVIDSIFEYIDCDRDGMITAENLNENLPKLNRKDKRYDIFALAQTGVRTKSLNDFILKNQKSSNGQITLAEFREAILYGFWNRQVTNTKILTDSTQSLSHLRWKNNDTIDKEAERYLFLQAEMNKKKEEEKMKNLK